MLLLESSVANTRRSSNADIALGQRHRRWTSMKPTLGVRTVFIWFVCHWILQKRHCSLVAKEYCNQLLPVQNELQKIYAYLAGLIALHSDSCMICKANRQSGCKGTPHPHIWGIDESTILYYSAHPLYIASMAALSTHEWVVPTTNGYCRNSASFFS